jgi:hypothetical protein
LRCDLVVIVAKAKGVLTLPIFTPYQEDARLLMTLELGILSAVASAW